MENELQEIRLAAAYNFPCFFSIFHSKEELTTHCLKLANDEDPIIRVTIAASIHEVFESAGDDEDTSLLRDALLSFIQTQDVPETPEIKELSQLKQALLLGLHKSIKHYANS